MPISETALFKIIDILARDGHPIQTMNNKPLLNITYISGFEIEEETLKGIRSSYLGIGLSQKTSDMIVRDLLNEGMKKLD